jgi:hypothetical protein
MTRSLAACLIALALVSPSHAGAADSPRAAFRDTYADTWAATDALGRTMPAQAECGPPKADRFIGIFYFLWLENRPGLKLYDIGKLLAENPSSPAWGPAGAFHWWGMPRFGYYTSDDEFVIRRHAQMLADAGIDVVVFDVTNGPTYDDALLTLCRVYEQMRKEGNRTPQIAFLANAAHDRVVTHLYESIYAKNRFPELWFRWKGKPLMMADPSGLSDEVRNFFTFRRSWAWTDPKGWFGDGKDKWPWLDHTPQRAGWHERPDKPEQISVAVAEHPISNIGRSFYDGKQPAAGELKTDEGVYFDEQWRRALAVDPEFVFVTGWNEWIAQRFIKQPGEERRAPTHLAGKRLRPGDTFFVDTYSQEYSRDIEPMAGGHGDNYYYQLVANVRRLKGVRPVPKASAPKTISIDNNFAQWSDVAPEYLDDIADTTHRDHPGYGDAGRYVNATGRNDFVAAKAARDDRNLYFYARTREPITAPQGTDWMVLLIDADNDSRTGWCGFDLAVNRNRSGDGTCSVERNVDGAWKWEGVGAAHFFTSGNELHVAIPRAPTGTGRSLNFRFKWTDHVPEVGDPLDLIDQGDAAPNGRFAYSYDGR